jgi:hypothetical protein
MQNSRENHQKKNLTPSIGVMQEKKILKEKKINPREKNPSILSIQEKKQRHSEV